MLRKAFSIVCLASIVLLAATYARAADKPNIVLCMADDQGWGDVGFRNHPVLKTPVMDELAATCLRFDRFYAAAPVCSPTRGSVLTGRHPNRFACFSWGHWMRPQETTVAEALKKAGYLTGHFGKWHLGPMRAESGASPGESGFDEWFSSPNFFENSPLMSRNGIVVETEGESSKVTVDAALQFIRSAAKRDEPFLAVVWFGSPHGPHIALEPDLTTYKDQDKKHQHFYGEITAMDRALGNLRTGLKDLGIADNTLLWYTSDNGALPVGSTGGLSGKKGNLLEGGIRVPAMIEWPAKIKAPRATSVPCNTVDIYPTLLEIAGATIENQPILDGVSLVPMIEGRMDKRDKPMGFWVHPTRGIGTRSTALLEVLRKEQRTGVKVENPDKRVPGDLSKQYPQGEFPGSAAWIDGKYKLLRRVAKNGKVTLALYDLEADPAEKTDLAAGEGKRVKRMEGALEAWQGSVVRSLNGEDYRK